MDGYEQPQRPAGHACIFVISYSAYILVFGSCYELHIATYRFKLILLFLIGHKTIRQKEY